MKQTTPEAQEHARRKRRAVSALRRSLEAARPVLDGADQRLMAYLDGVLAKPKAHNLYEIAGAAVFCRKVVRYEWDDTRAMQFARFYECLPFDGPQGRTSYRLTPVQMFVVANIFGLYTINAAGHRVRLTRDVYIFVPRKFAKTTFCSALMLWWLLFESYNAEAYAIANSYQQARVLFDMSRSAMLALDPEQKLFRVNRETIFFQNRTAQGARASKAVCLAANPKNLDGLFAELVIRDEGAQARDTATKSGSDLKNVLVTSEGPREQPLNVDISTASDVVDGPFHREIEGVEKMIVEILSTKYKVPATRKKQPTETSNDRLFGLLFLPDVGDREDDPKTWAKVQPHLGVTVSPDYYELEWQRAQLSADNMLAFRTKLLNIFCVNEATPWLGLALAQKMHYDWDPLTGHGMEHLDEPPVTMAAVDLSVRGDFTAVTFAAYIPSLRQTWTHTRYYLPEGVMATHARRHHYQHLLDAGHIYLTPGDTIDPNTIADYVMDVANAGHVELRKVGYDQYRSTPFVNRMVEIGNPGIEENLIPMGQTMGPFTSWSMAYQQAARTGHILIAPNPLTDEAFQGAYLETSRDGITCKPMKIDPSPTGKRIDGLITNIMAHGLFIDQGHRTRNNDVVA